PYLPHHTTVQPYSSFFFLFNAPPPPDISTLSLHDALPISAFAPARAAAASSRRRCRSRTAATVAHPRAPVSSSASRRMMRQVLRSEEHTSELQSRSDLVCRLLLEKKKNK